MDILLKATGDAPIMKKKKWLVDRDKKIGWVTEFIKRYVKALAEESMVSVDMFCKQHALL